MIVVTHGGCERALATLASARASTGGAAVEWLVVDSGSTDGTPTAVERRFPDIDVMRLPNVGFAAANNAALPHARGRYVLLLNPDIEIVAGTLADLVAALDERPQVGAASVVQTWPDGGLQRTIRRFPTPARQLGEALLLNHLPGLASLGEEVANAADYDRETVADWLVGSFLIVRRGAFDDAGPMDERFFLFSEETDLCRRVCTAGWEIHHLPIMRVIHHTGHVGRPDLFAQTSYSKLQYAEKHCGRSGRRCLRAALVLRHGLRVAARVRPLSAEQEHGSACTPSGAHSAPSSGFCHRPSGSSSTIRAR